MTNSRRSQTIATFAAAMLILAASAVPFSAAQNHTRGVQPGVVISQMAGTWYATLSGVTGCGVTTLTTTFTLDSTGNGTQTSATQHTAGCGDIDLSGQTSQLQVFNSDASGFLALGCGSGCGFGFNIQVAKNGQVFVLGAQAVSGNYLAGTAIRK
jgi:hypothetical protein